LSRSRKSTCSSAWEWFAAVLAFLWGERRRHVLVALGVALPLIVFLFFDAVFDIRFPRGVLTNLWYG